MSAARRFRHERMSASLAANHVGHDADYAAMQLVNWLVTTVCAVPVPVSGGPVARNLYVRRCAGGDIPRGIPASVAGILARHAPLRRE